MEKLLAMSEKVIKRFILIGFILGVIPSLWCQEKFSFDGYISQMGTFQKLTDSTPFMPDYTLHNRLNFAWFPSNRVTIQLQIRNQFLWGKSISKQFILPQNFTLDRGLIDLNHNWTNGDNYLLNSQIDRASVQWEKDKFEITLGRQRINWGRTLVWNPNDIFNAYSYYEFDYTEKPGSDALKMVYYSGTAASTELVLKSDSTRKISVGMLTKWNRLGYDFQVLAGTISDEDVFAGFGWEGSLEKFSFRGEVTYYHPQTNLSDSLGVFLASVGTDISFDNQLMLQSEFLYNDKKTRTTIYQMMATPQTAKSLSVSEYNLFINATYPVSPVFSLYGSAMYYADQKGLFLMPGCDISFADNVNLSAIYQYFNVELVKNQRIDYHAFFVRLKWNF